MTLVLDTQAFIWMTDRPERLSPTAADALADASNDLLVSHVSIWEMQIKHGLGKLELSVDPITLAHREAEAGSVRLLPIVLADLAGLSILPMHHRDPFDRLLVSQSVRLDLPLVSSDEQLDAYGIQRIW